MYRWVLNTSRTGSHWLADLLNLTNLFPTRVDNRAFGEWFWYQPDIFKDPPLCAVFQLHHLSPNTYDFMSSRLKDFRFIILKRRDLLDQIASYYMAHKTEVWRVSDNDKNKNSKQEYLSTEVDIDADLLLQSYNKIVSRREHWKDFIGQPNTLEVYYEDLTDSPIETLNGIMRFFEVEFDWSDEFIQKCGMLRLQKLKEKDYELVKKRLMTLVSL